MDAVVENRAIRNQHAGRALGAFFSVLLVGFGVLITENIPLRLLFLVMCIFSASEFGHSLGRFFEARKTLRGLPSKTKFQNVEDRLDELERLKRRDMVSPEEYATKRQEILKDL